MPITPSKANGVVDRLLESLTVQEARQCISGHNSFEVRLKPTERCYIACVYDNSAHLWR